MFVIVVGMHRSGTSMMSRILIDSGIDMNVKSLAGLNGNDRITQLNKLTKFEDSDIGHINETIIKDSNREWWNCIGSETKVTKDVENAMKEYVAKRNNGDSSIIGFKDPRTTLFFDYWDKHISEKIVIAMRRSPKAVIANLETNDGYDNDKSMAIWKLYNQSVDDILQNPSFKSFEVIYEYLVYDKFYREYIFNEIGKYLNIKIDYSFINPVMDHSKVITQP